MYEDPIGMSNVIWLGELIRDETFGKGLMSEYLPIVFTAGPMTDVR